MSEKQWSRLKAEIPKLYGRESADALPHDSEYVTALHDVLAAMKRIERGKEDATPVHESPEELAAEIARLRGEVAALTSDRDAAYSRGVEAGADLLRNDMRVLTAAEVAHSGGSQQPNETPSEQPTEGTKVIRVQRACNGCGENIRPATKAELEGCVVGQPLPDVTGECSTCAPPASDLESRVTALEADNAVLRADMRQAQAAIRGLGARITRLDGESK